MAVASVETPHGETSYYYNKKGCRCHPCRAYSARLRAASRARGGGLPHPYLRIEDGSIPALIIDILETHCGTWWTIDRLTQEASRIRGQMVSPDVVRRGAMRLIKRGLVETRKGLHGIHKQGNLPGSPDITEVVERVELMRRTRAYLTLDYDEEEGYAELQLG